MRRSSRRRCASWALCSRSASFGSSAPSRAAARAMVRSATSEPISWLARKASASSAARRFGSCLMQGRGGGKERHDLVGADRRARDRIGLEDFERRAICFHRGAIDLLIGIEGPEPHLAQGGGSGVAEQLLLHRDHFAELALGGNDAFALGIDLRHHRHRGRPPPQRQARIVVDDAEHFRRIGERGRRDRRDAAPSSPRCAGCAPARLGFRRGAREPVAGDALSCPPAAASAWRRICVAARANLSASAKWR